MSSPFVSVIIPYPKDNPFLQECMEHLLQIDYTEYEVILLPDEEESHDWPKTTIIPTGKIGPSEKRDIGLKHAKGEIVAFLDDDTFPVKEWLKKGVRHFVDPEIAAVGGPAVTPANDGPLQQASGAVYESPLVSGQYTYRYVAKKRQFVDDYPSCNLMVRKEIMDQIGGYNSQFYPGEDTVICLKITKELKKNILYDPDALVYHHRRNVYRAHLKQIKNYALHRGYFVKKFPQTSLRFSYFVPSLFTAGVSIGWLAGLAFPFLMSVYIAVVTAYLGLVFYTSFFSKNVNIWRYVFFGVILTHLTYGFWFMVGLVSNKMREETVVTTHKEVPVS